MNATTPLSRSDMEAFWLPFTPNRQFKAKPRLLSRAKGMYYWTPDGRQILDAVAGLWCVNAGHGRTEITQAVAAQLETMDYAPPFQMGHPPAFALANAVVKIAPRGFDHVFFTNSGSESVDTALKIALAYQRARGEGTHRSVIGSGVLRRHDVWPLPVGKASRGTRHSREGARVRAGEFELPSRWWKRSSRCREHRNPALAFRISLLSAMSIAR